MPLRPGEDLIDQLHAGRGRLAPAGKAIVSDLASGSALLHAAAEGAFLNVRINASLLTNRDLADKTMERAQTVFEEIYGHQQRIANRVEALLA